MNIFYISDDVEECSKWAVDKHIVKMCLEYSQLLSTAHRILDGVQYFDFSGGRKIKRWKLIDDRENVLYKATHINHPSAVWARKSIENYLWLYLLLDSFLKEYTYRYGKIHKIDKIGLFEKLKSTPINLKDYHRTEMPSCMAPEYIISSNPIENYRNYYKGGKKHLHRWTKRNPPDWIK